MGALTARFSSWKQIYPAPPEIFASRNIVEQLPKPNIEFPPSQTKRQTATKPSTLPPPTISRRPPPPHAVTSLTHGDPGFGFEDIEELDSVVNDVREQFDDREAVQDQVDDGKIGRHRDDDGEAALDQDDGVGAVRDKVGEDGQDEGTGGVEEVPRTRSDRLRRPNVRYSTVQ
jgi:hypothetical protein